MGDRLGRPQGAASFEWALDRLGSPQGTVSFVAAPLTFSGLSVMWLKRGGAGSGPRIGGAIDLLVLPSNSFWAADGSTFFVVA